MAVRNKNSHRGSPVGAGNKGVSVSGDLTLIQSLGGGTFARVYNPLTGGSTHCAVGSVTFLECVDALVTAGLTARVAAELSTLAVRFPSTDWSAAEALTTQNENVAA
jgi:thiamine biosynthesis lipoprotein ApbE